MEGNLDSDSNFLRTTPLEKRFEEQKVQSLNVAEKAILKPIFELLEKWHKEINNKDDTPIGTQNYITAKNQLAEAVYMFKEKYGSIYPRIGNFLDAIKEDLRNWSGNSL